jgi:hypothetical protein
MVVVEVAGPAVVIVMGNVFGSIGYLVTGRVVLVAVGFF